MSNLMQRLIVSIFLIVVIAFSLILSDKLPYALLLAILMVTTVGSAIWEYYHMAEVRGYTPLTYLGILTSVLYIFTLFSVGMGWAPSVLPFVVLAAGGLLFFLSFFGQGADALVNIAITAFGVVYIAMSLGTLISINYFFDDRLTQDGRWWIFYLLSVTKVTDTGAYFIGRLLGRVKLAPVLSPKKTYEGALGGLIAAIGVSLIFAYMAVLFPAVVKIQLSLWDAMWFGAILSFVAQVGDLAESLIKRDAGVKHSNRLPGMGGMLDIVDSMIFTAPLLYFFLSLK